MEANYKPKDETQQTRRNKLIFKVTAYMLGINSEFEKYILKEAVESHL